MDKSRVSSDRTTKHSKHAKILNSAFELVFPSVAMTFHLLNINGAGTVGYQKLKHAPVVSVTPIHWMMCRMMCRAKIIMLN